MSAFNVLVHAAECPTTRRSVTLRTQFKYGHTRQIEYKLGDFLAWGDNDVGKRGKRKVVVDGVAEECPACNSEHDFDIFVQEDRLDSVAPHSGKYDYATAGQTYIILEE